MNYLLFGLLAAVNAFPEQGNCVSGKLSLDKITPMKATPGDADPTQFDFTIDYGVSNVKPNGKGGAEIGVKGAAGQKVGDGARLTSTRFIHYGKITAKMTSIGVPGIVTAFITMSPSKDEIDFEVVGKDTTSMQTNIFYRGIPEYSKYGGIHKLSSPTTEVHEYTIDWKRDAITFSIDGKVVRTWVKNSAAAATTNPAAKGQPWYPTEATQIQLGVWDGGVGGTQGWAGGPVAWNGQQYNARVESVEVTCYDENDKPVAQFPGGSVPPPTQPTVTTKPTAPATSNVATTTAPSTGVTSAPVPAASSLVVGASSAAPATTTTKGDYSAQPTITSSANVEYSALLSLIAVFVNII